MRIRRSLVKVHVWLGLVLGGFWALQGLTGATLVFNRDIQPLLLDNPTAPAVPMLSLDAVFAKASGAAGAKVTRIENFTPDPNLLVAYYEDADGRAKTVVIDARTGVALDRRDPEPALPAGGSTWKWILNLHESLLAGDRGKVLVGVSGLLLLTSLILGFVIAWPKRQAWKPVYAVRKWRGAQARLFGWHRMLGLTLGAVLVVSVIGGSYMAFAAALRPFLVSTLGYQPPLKAKAVKKLEPVRITAETALLNARTMFPNAVLVRATLPTPQSPVYQFRLLQQGEGRRWAGTTAIQVDPMTGSIVGLYDPLKGPLINRVTDLIYPIHTGEIAGPIARVLIMLGGLTLPTLYITGIWAYLRSRRKRLAPKPDAIAAAAG